MIRAQLIARPLGTQPRGHLTNKWIDQSSSHLKRPSLPSHLRPRRGNQAQAPAPQAVEIGSTGDRLASYQARPRHLIWVPPGAPPAQEPVAPLHRPQRLFADARAVPHRHDGRFRPGVPRCVPCRGARASGAGWAGEFALSVLCGRGYEWHLWEGVYRRCNEAVGKGH